MSHVIRKHGDANSAQTIDGQWISRSKEIYVPSHHRAYPCLPTSLHFCFRDPHPNGRPGSTMFCTCGSPAGVFDFTAYGRWTGINHGEVIACVEFIQQGRHADGSHE